MTIDEATALLRNNGYMVFKIPDCQCGYALTDYKLEAQQSLWEQHKQEHGIDNGQ